MTSNGSGPLPRIRGFLTQTLDYGSLFARLRQGRLLITANNRLARVLGNQYVQWRIATGDAQWPSPDMVSWSAWLDNLWDSAAIADVAGTNRTVPGNSQLLSLWEKVLRDTPLNHDLLRPESLSSQLRDTRKLIMEWQLDLAHPAWFDGENENCAAFGAWNRAFEQCCRRHRWISPEDRTVVLADAIRNSAIPIPGTVDLLGFDEFNPAQADLLNTLIDSGCRVCSLDIESRQEKAVLLACRDDRHELRQAASWVRRCMEDDPRCTIAIVVPDLGSRRHELEWHLEEMLAPGSDAAGEQARPWNVSIGAPLLRFPMIEAAFDLLKLLDRSVHIQDISRVLRSPWLNGSVGERNNRALLEKRLCDQYPRQLKLSEAEYRSREIRKHDRYHAALPEEEHGEQPWNSPLFNSILNTLIRFEADNRDRKPASAWAQAFDQLLGGVGWPFAEQADVPALERDQNWQVLQAWREALHELASLDTSTAPLGLHAAVRQLQQVCREMTFQPATLPASVQLLGLYEVNGLRFDHLWVLGMSADTWPSTARPNPFIPARLQIAADTPRSSPQRELAVAQTITRRLLDTAPDCVFSYPAKLDGQDVLPSPLLDTPGVVAVSAVPTWQGDTWRKRIAAAEKPCAQPLAMPGKLVHATARGGSSILENQALCPFRAFATNRLGAEGLQTPTDGISPMLHGSLVHGVLEHFWKETRTQEALMKLGAASLEERVRKHVFRVTRDNRGLKQRPAFRAVEAERILRHVLAYLELEKERGNFEAIGFEQVIHARIEGQIIRLVIDRVDRLPGGEEAIIDYKTGMRRPKRWFGDRPEDPQLPLYAISAEKTPAAVVFGIIRADACEYKGVVTTPGLFPDLPPRETNTTRYLVEAGNRMPETVENWRGVLHRLMSDFLAGHAEVDPKHGRNTCRGSYCELQSLCRIGELEQLGKTRREACK
ncbi:MAG: PD-(D/E)XK nuclease family protein [Lysobacterales bacterium]|jgi:probable DNA repair protein